MPLPDFAALFVVCSVVCSCGQSECEACTSWQLTPRTALVLWTALGIMADQGDDDVQLHGDDRVTSDGRWTLFDRYPRVTWTQDALWRRQAARSYDDLASDLEEGRWPLPRCSAEEMVLRLALHDAEVAVDDGWSGLDRAATWPSTRTTWTGRCT